MFQVSLCNATIPWLLDLQLIPQTGWLTQQKPAQRQNNEAKTKSCWKIKLQTDGPD
uniref:Uncharacterized protein MANES_06G100100 n=1 Tax=Rhizophora mucronata TaxID=61149 RepID=A0A2P2KXI4_RHIMU